MAEFSIDEKKLPGVKEVCRDFAVLEDHCLAHNLQEQEIESHLASNVHKSRLVQQDLQVAKKLQEEEDKRAKVQNQRQYRDIERQDNEIAHEIQEELVRQAEQQRQQEEKDAAIARKLQEKLMKEERKRQKQLEANFEEEYFEDQGAARGPHDLDKPSRHGSGPDRHSPSQHGEPNEPISSHREHSPEHSSVEPKRSRYPKQDPVAPHSRSRYPEHYPPADGGRSRHADPYPEHLHSPRGKHKDRYPDYQPTETGRVRGQRGDEVERVVRRKDRPARPPAPHNPIERDRDRERDYDREGNRLGDRERDKNRDREKGRNVERDMGRDQRRDRDDPARRDQERDRGRGQTGDKARERHRQKDREGHMGRTRSRERVLEEEPVPGHSRDLLREERVSREEVEMVDDYGDGERERRARGRHCVYPGPGEVFEEHRSDDGRGERREAWDPRDGEGPSRERSDTDPSRETGRLVHRGGGPVVAGSEFGMKEATQGLTRLDIREQEIIDMEVARKLQEEELKASKIDKRAAQVAQDEEIARLLMEQEKKEYKKNKEKEKEKEREKEKDRERLAMERMERRRHEGEYRPSSEEVVRPRTREEQEYQRQRNHNKPSRPPQPRAHDYENVNSSPYGYSENPFTPRAPSRPEAAYKGAYYRQ